MIRKSLILLTICLVVSGCAPRVEDKVRIGRDTSGFPANFGGREKAVSAFSDDLMRAIASEEDLPISLVAVNWETMFHQLSRDRIDGMLSAMPPIPEYRALYDFSDIYLYTGPVLMVREGFAVDSLEGMRGMIIGVTIGSPGVLIAAKVPDVVIHDYFQVSRSLQALTEGKIDGVVLEALDAYAYVRDLYAGILKVATPPLTKDGMRLVVLRGEQEELIEAFNRGLQKTVKDSTYKQLQKKWKLALNEGPHPMSQV